MTSIAHASVSEDEDVDPGELSSEYFDAPLQLSDIMPKNRRLYDKMRPPMFKGKSTFNLTYNLQMMSARYSDRLGNLAEKMPVCPSHDDSDSFILYVF